MAQEVGKRANVLASLPGVGLKQTVKADGKPRSDQVAVNPEEPPAKRFDIPTPPKGTSGREIASIVSEFNVPPLKPDLSDTGLAEFPYFDDKVMKDYKDSVSIEEIMMDKEKYRLRVATLNAFNAIREVWAGNPADGGPGKLEDVIKAPITDDIKKRINKGLEFYAVGIANLELINLALDEVAVLKEGETKRWQAHYEYARAVVKARLAYLNEFNKLMGDVRTETMPRREMNEDAYKLVSSETMKSKRDIQMLAEQAQEAYVRLISEHKGTPWAIQAKREKNFSLGLAWRPISTKKDDPADPK